MRKLVIDGDEIPNDQSEVCLWSGRTRGRKNELPASQSSTDNALTSMTSDCLSNSIRFEPQGQESGGRGMFNEVS